MMEDLLLNIEDEKLMISRWSSMNYVRLSSKFIMFLTDWQHLLWF